MFEPKGLEISLARKKKVTEVVPCLVAGREDHFVEVAFGQRVAGKSALQARKVLTAGF